MSIAISIILQSAWYDEINQTVTRLDIDLLRLKKYLDIFGGKYWFNNFLKLFD